VRPPPVRRKSREQGDEEMISDAEIMEYSWVEDLSPRPQRRV
jgi:hypothetical protein